MVQIEQVDLESWTPKDFAMYVRTKLEEKGITYKIRAPYDFIMMGKLLKDHRKRGGTNYLIKQKVDGVFDNFNLTSVSSLQFIYNLCKPEKIEKEKTVKLKNEDVHLSDELKLRLETLKNE